MSKEFKINLLEEMDLLYAKIHRLEDVCEQANIMLNQRDEIEEGLNKRIAELEAENRKLKNTCVERSNLETMNEVM